MAATQHQSNNLTQSAAEAEEAPVQAAQGTVSAPRDPESKKQNTKSGHAHREEGPDYTGTLSMPNLFSAENPALTPSEEASLEKAIQCRCPGHSHEAEPGEDADLGSKTTAHSIVDGVKSLASWITGIGKKNESKQQGSEKTILGGIIAAVTSNSLINSINKSISKWWNSIDASSGALTKEDRTQLAAKVESTIAALQKQGEKRIKQANLSRETELQYRKELQEQLDELRKMSAELRPIRQRFR